MVFRAAPNDILVLDGQAMTEDPQKKYEELVRRARRQFESGPGDATDGEARTSATRTTEHRPPKQVGPYRIIDVLGSGGMGVVYLAEQEEPIRRRVALKVIKRGLDSEQVVARFEVERHALALMNHPNVAQVFDAGIADDGRPYFAMEYVQGERITDYCDRRRLKMVDRLRLFQHVCSAIQHAHQRGIIHRDIKPSNVLVAEHEEKPVPKVIDFGVAKATRKDPAGGTLLTEQGQLLGTPEYMSPEQLDAEVDDVDTRTDVYSLGVLLYELVAGALPFDSATLRQAGVAEIHRVIKEQDPPKPSTRLSGLGDEAATIAHDRGAERASLARQLRGDVDWIIMKALEKDRSRRYESPSAFSQDLGRYLKDEPVEAGPPSRLYRFRKLIVRNKVLSVSSAVAVVALIVIAVVALLAGDRLARQVAREQAVVRFLVDDTLRSFTPGGLTLGVTDNASLAHVSVRDVLDHAFKSFPLRFQDTSSAGAIVQVAGAESYLGIGETEKALHLLKRAKATFEAAGTQADAEYARCLTVSGYAFAKSNQLDLAERNLEAAEAAWRRLPGSHDAGVARIAGGRALIDYKRGHFEASAEKLQRAIELLEQAPTQQTLHLLEAKHNLAMTLDALDRTDEAQLLYKEIVAIARSSFGTENLLVAVAMSEVGRSYFSDGNLDAALPLSKESWSVRRRILGPDHEDTVVAALHVSETLNYLKRYGECVEFLRRELPQVRELKGENVRFTYEWRFNLGVCLSGDHRCDEAIPELERALDGFRELKDNSMIHACEGQVAGALELCGRHDEAEPHYRRLLKQAEDFFPDDPRRAAYYLDRLARYLYFRARYEEAVPLARRNLDIWTNLDGAPAERIANAQYVLAMSLAGVGEYAEAERLTRAYLPFYKATMDDDPLPVYWGRNLIGDCLRGLGRFEEAESILLETHKAIEQQPNSAWQFGIATERLIKWPAPQELLQVL
jgi:eukaryotic-like serine/threonine-protein kinase